MPTYRISEAAALLGVSDDTVRRWADSGQLPTVREPGSRQVVEGAALADFAVSAAADLAPGGGRADRRRVGPQPLPRHRHPGRPGHRDGPGRDPGRPFRVVSLMSREAADELGLEPGVLAVAAVKSTSVVVEVPQR